MGSLARRGWVTAATEDFVQRIVRHARALDEAALAARVEELATQNRFIHERQCINLNPATNVMNPRAEALLASGLGSRPSLGYPGNKYEMGLEAIEQIEVIAAELAARVFDAQYAEVRVGSGALANLYAFMSTTQPGDAVIVPPASLGGHVTHHQNGAAGLYGLQIHQAPVDERGCAPDLHGLRELAYRVRPKLITIGGSLNLFPHPVREIRAIADEVGAHVLFDAAHVCGLIAGKAWRNPLHEGAHLMSMSTYKSLGGPPGGLIVTNSPQLAEKIDAIAYPGLTANFDVAKAAALAITLLDWVSQGESYAREMIDSAQSLARSLADLGAPVFATAVGNTGSHQFALQAASFGGGQSMARSLRKANILASGIGLPLPAVAGDLNGLRLGTPEIVRWGMTASDMPELARLMVAALRADDPCQLAGTVSEWRRKFNRICFVRSVKTTGE